MAVPTVTCNSSQCQGVKPVMQQRHFISHPDQTGHARSTSVQNQNYYKRAIVNDRKRKSSRIHVLCDDVVLFRQWSKNLSAVCTGTAFPFLSNAIRTMHQSENQFKGNFKTSNRTKEANKGSKNDLAWFLCPMDGAANLQSARNQISRGCKRN